MTVYLNNFYIALIFWGIVAAFSIVPVVFYYYKKYGHFGGARGVAIYIFILSMMAAYFMVIFPLPEVTENFCAIRAGKLEPNFELFRFIKDISHELQAKHILYTEFYKSRSLLATVLNLLLLFPLGFFLNYLFKMEFWKVVLLGFLVSLFFELTQLTGNFGIYPCAYRLFEVDDLMTNTISAVLGYTAAKYFRFLPNVDITKDRSNTSINVTARFLIFIVDISIFKFILNHLIPSNQASLGWYWAYMFILFVLYYVVIPKHLLGTTVAGKIFGAKPIDDTSKAKPSYWQLGAYYAVVVIIPVMLNRTFNSLYDGRVDSGWWAILFFALWLSWAFFVGILPLIRKDQKGLQNIVSGVKLVLTRGKK